MSIRVQSEAFDVGTELEVLRAANPKVGAIVSFVGIARDINDDQAVTSLTLEHYPGMTERALEQIVADARKRWNVLGARVVHRVGTLAPLDPIVLVAVCSMHRHDAFEACRFIIDFLKTDAPFWKREQTASGSRWVEARHSDDRARQRWNPPDPATGASGRKMAKI
jgi:molybdopterin synthase catalytic subunit